MFEDPRIDFEAQSYGHALAAIVKKNSSLKSDITARFANSLKGSSIKRFLIALPIFIDESSEVAKKDAGKDYSLLIEKLIEPVKRDSTTEEEINLYHSALTTLAQKHPDTQDHMVGTLARDIEDCDGYLDPAIVNLSRTIEVLTPIFIIGKRKRELVPVLARPLLALITQHDPSTSQDDRLLTVFIHRISSLIGNMLALAGHPRATSRSEANEKLLRLLAKAK